MKKIEETKTSTKLSTPKITSNKPRFQNLEERETPRVERLKTA